MLRPGTKLKLKFGKLLSRDTFQTALFFAAMIAVLAACGWLIWGPDGALIAAVMPTLAAVFVPKIPTRLIMRFQGAEPASFWQSPEVFRLVEVLSRKAGLSVPPSLYVHPMERMTAFTAGSGDNAGLAISLGALRGLPPRELNAVLAHEISHIAAGDTAKMLWSALAHQFTHTIALMGLLLTLFVALFAGVEVPLWIPLVFAGAPLVVLLLQRALSRQREFAADEQAVRLTGDPQGLALALARIEASERWSLGRLFAAPLSHPLGGVLRTHPETDERIERLLGAESQCVARSPHQFHNKVHLPPWVWR